MGAENFLRFTPGPLTVSGPVKQARGVWDNHECIVNYSPSLTYPLLRNTPPKFNMEPENDGFQEELPFLGTSFQVPC